MTSRLLVAGVAAALLTPAFAAAAPAPTCTLVRGEVDPLGDAATDLTSLRVCTTRTGFRFQLAVRDLGSPSDRVHPVSARWIVGFTIGLQAFDYEATRSPYDDPPSWITLDYARDEVVFDISTDFLKRARRTSPLRHLRAYSAAHLAVPRMLGLGSGTTLAQADHLDGGRACHPAC